MIKTLLYSYTTLLTCRNHKGGQLEGITYDLNKPSKHFDGISLVGCVVTANLTWVDTIQVIFAGMCVVCGSTVNPEGRVRPGRELVVAIWMLDFEWNLWTVEFKGIYADFLSF